ncbi:M48 family metalloprotease [Candidatus Micrarchaeota archaeon]|nr:M48 family metalloprotease [Candidatus Micrarchaeota archaeon]
MADERFNHISFFDAIESNKRNSIIFVFAMLVLFLFSLIAFSFILDLDPLVMIIIGCFFFAIYALIMYYTGDKLVLGLGGAKEAKKEDYPFLYNVVEGLSLAMQMPMPKLYIVNDPSPNAFATGRDPQHSSVAVTTGLLAIMNREELEGVLAHEISHIGNYDIRFAMVAIIFAGAIALMGEFVWRMMRFGIGGGSSSNRKGGGGILILIGLVFIILAPIFAEIIRFALSRERESLADANGARITRYPAGLASALEKIKKAAIPTKTANDTTAPLYFSNPFPDKIGFLFATHPQIDERIKRLRAM